MIAAWVVGLIDGFDLRRAAAGDVRLAETLEDFDIEAWAVVGDHDLDLACRPARVDRDDGLGEVDSVLDQIAEGVQDFGSPLNRKRAVAFGGDSDVDAEAAMRLG